MNSKWLSISAVVFSFLFVFSISIPQQAFALAVPAAPSFTAAAPAVGTVTAVTGTHNIIFNPATRQFSNAVVGSKIPAGAILFTFGSISFGGKTTKQGYSNASGEPLATTLSMGMRSAFLAFALNGYQSFSPPGTKAKSGSGSNSETEIIDSTNKDTEVNVVSGP